MQENLQKLNSEQLQAVTQKKGPILIIAGAGTGKTTVITTRIAWLIQEKLAKPEEILALTFTEKAAEEMETRVDQLMPYGYFDLWISTFHAFCDRIFHTDGLEIGLSTDYKLLTQTDQWILMRENLDKFVLNYYKPLGNPSKFIQALITHFSRLKDENIKPQKYLEYAESLAENFDSKMDKEKLIGEKQKIIEVANAFHAYQNLLLENNFLDFGDLINYTLELFQKRPLVLEKFQKQFKYILVDEFQDTNWAQYELVKILALDKNKPVNLTVVADDDQAIYRFRGASTSNVLNFIKDFPQARIITLKENYRSKQNILDLAYNFIQLNNPDRLEAVGTMARQKNKENTISKSLHANIGSQGIIKHLECSDLENEIQKVMQRIRKIIQKNNSSYSCFAILSRTNSGLEPFINGLRKNNIPYLWYSSRGLYQKKVILDILAYFKLLDSYHESSALFRVLNLPIFQIDYQDIIQINFWSKQRGISIFQTLKAIESNPLFLMQKDDLTEKHTAYKLKEESISSIKKFLALAQKHTALVSSNSKISEIFLNFLNDSGYLKLIEKQSEQEKKDNFAYLNQFYKKIQKFEEKLLNEPTLKNFLIRMNIEMESGDTGVLEADLDAGPDAVRVMTVHSAKGLEFDYVFVVNMVDKRFPTIEYKDQIEIPKNLIKEILPQGDAHLQEERRLFYVACTRAKKGLFFTSAQDYGGMRAKKPSRFLIEAKIIQQPIMKIQPIKDKLFDFSIAKPNSQTSETGVKKRNGYLDHKLSFTRFKAFNTCPKQYEYQFILHIPTRGSYTHSFGTSMHNTMLKFFQKLQISYNHQQSSFFSASKDDNLLSSVSWQELKEIYQSNWVDAWYENKKQKEEFFRKGLKELKKFYDLHKKKWPNVMFLEKGFNLKIGDWRINGRVDRIDKLENNTVEIIDYKTGRAKNKLQSDDKTQLFLYQWAVEEILGLKVEKTSYYFFENNQKLSFQGKAKDIEKVKQKFSETGEKIKDSDFTPSPGFHCQYCDFKEICDERKV